MKAHQTAPVWFRRDLRLTDIQHCSAGPDRPDRCEISRLSPRLHFGDIGPRQIVAALRHSDAGAARARGIDSYLRQIGWREFAYHLLFHFPPSTKRPLDVRLAKQKCEAVEPTCAPGNAVSPAFR
ncbi:hypothetical protein JM946_01200 [Steroidobacter sp. S1-65]|uniref:Uncharacterized protein n=1 Tax=Steroidobacter gossypii TaxID=2805490 RepID=A0ABS1WQS9_9GAMM|nr:hypothetical protein [Steroidobacter gossypii]MBM0103335.1 hypothetical protein [Steroidobacter gossypii]